MRETLTAALSSSRLLSLSSVLTRSLWWEREGRKRGRSVSEIQSSILL